MKNVFLIKKGLKEWERKTKRMCANHKLQSQSDLQHNQDLKITNKIAYNKSDLKDHTVVTT